MRRAEKEITEKSEIEAILREAVVCRLAMSENDRPYIVPLSFGYKDNALYFHGAKEGKKIDILKKNPWVCFEIDLHAEPVKAEDACFWGMKFKSVIGFGKAFFIEEDTEKEKALTVIMSQYSDAAYIFDENFIRATAVVKVEIESMTGKRSGEEI
jgi:nitroimidazol reductase NimA-like FMN-containing flavoprotein (pyridoxamine 5'-phosphate oxidase superfamily)